jgi:hypothetical protein
VIVVDDGIATGAMMKAALRGKRRLDSRRSRTKREPSGHLGDTPLHFVDRVARRSSRVLPKSRKRGIEITQMKRLSSWVASWAASPVLGNAAHWNS